MNWKHWTDLLVRWWPCVSRGMLAFWIALLIDFRHSIGDMIHGKEPIDLLHWTDAVVGAFLAGGYTLSQFLNTTLSRHAAELKQEDSGHPAFVKQHQP